MSEDIEDRLLRAGSDAFHKHYSLGMAKLCVEAVEEIRRLNGENFMLRQALYDEQHGITASTRDWE